MPPRFLDTNILLRYLTRDDERKAEAALALLVRVERGEEKVVTSPLVIFETVFTLEKSYDAPRATIRQRLDAIIGMRGLQLAGKRVYLQALELYATMNVSFADAYNAAYLKDRELNEIYSWDKDFDKIDGVARVEPAL